MSQGTPSLNSRAARAFSAGSSLLVLVGPAMVLLVAFLAVPFLLAAGLSVTSQRLVSPLPTQFVGLENYARILDDPRFWHALTNNFVFALIVPTAQTVLGLGLALMVNQPLRGISVFRTIYFAPVVIVLAVASVVWRLLFAESGMMINAGIGAVTGGSFQPNWLHDPTLLPRRGHDHVDLAERGLPDGPPACRSSGDPGGQVDQAARVDGANGWQLLPGTSPSPLCTPEHVDLRHSGPPSWRRSCCWTNRT